MKDKIRKNQQGSAYIELIIAVAVITALIMSFMTLPDLYVKKQNIDYMANAIARSVEISGEIGSDTQKLINELKQSTGLNPVITWDGPFYDANGSRRIQLRDTFHVTLSMTVKIKIIEPSFSGPVYLDIPMKKQVKGVSEIYWKP